MYEESNVAPSSETADTEIPKAKDTVLSQSSVSSKGA